MSKTTDAARLVFVLVAVALVLAYLFFSSVEFKTATLIYFTLFTISMLVITNADFFKKNPFVGLLLFIGDFFLVTNLQIQNAFLAAASIIFLIPYFFIIPKVVKVIN